MKLTISLLCLLGILVTSGQCVKFSRRNVEGGAVQKEEEFKKYIPDDDPFDFNAIDQEKLGTLGKLLTGVTDLVRGVMKGLEPSIQAVYAVIIPTVRIIVASGKIKVCRPQSRVEVLVWFIKEFINVQLNADLGVAQIPLCVGSEEPFSLLKWNITYEIPDQFKKQPGYDKTAAELLASPLGGSGTAGDIIPTSPDSGLGGGEKPAEGGDAPAGDAPAGDAPAPTEPGTDGDSVTVE